MGNPVHQVLAVATVQTFAVPWPEAAAAATAAVETGDTPQLQHPWR